MSFLLLFGIWLIIAVVVLRNDTPLAIAFRLRLITLLGVVLILGSFFFADWLRFDFVQYLGFGSLADLLRELAPELLGILGQGLLSRVTKVLLGALALKGWMLVFIPSFGWTIRAALVFPPLVAVGAFLWLLGVLSWLLVVHLWLPGGATYRGSTLRKIVGFLLALFSLLALIGLAAAIPEVDALGVHDQVKYSSVATLAGVRLELGPWLTMIGLALLFVGGLIEIIAGRANAKPIEAAEAEWPG